MTKLDAIKISLDFFNGSYISDESMVFDFSDIFYISLTTEEQYKSPTSLPVFGIPNILIEKENKFIYTFSSGIDVNEALEKFREIIFESEIIIKYIENYSHRKKYDIVILKILNIEELIQLMLDLSFSYVVPEVIGNVIWRQDATFYTKEKLEERLLNKLPIKFSDNYHQTILEFCLHQESCKNCEFELIENSTKKEWNLKKANKSDLEIEW